MTVEWVNGVVDYSGTFLARMATDGLKYAAAFFGSFAISLLLTPLVREAAVRSLARIGGDPATRALRARLPDVPMHAVNAKSAEGITPLAYRRQHGNLPVREKPGARPCREPRA